MLVITRRENEEVVIGDPADPIGKVRVSSIRGDRVRLAFDFPKHIQVHRAEVAAEIKAEAGSPLARKRDAEPAVGSGGQPGGKPVDSLAVGDTYDPDKPGATDRQRATDSQAPASAPRNPHDPNKLTPRRSQGWPRSDA